MFELRLLTPIYTETSEVNFVDADEVSLPCSTSVLVDSF